jgi:hypothetical protein
VLLMLLMLLLLLLVVVTFIVTKVLGVNVLLLPVEIWYKQIETQTD